MPDNKITLITIAGTVERAGDCVQDNPGVVIRDSEGNAIKLSLSREEAKMFAMHLFEEVQLVFDAQVKFFDSK